MNLNNSLNIGRVSTRHVGLKPDLPYFKHTFADKEFDETAVTEDSSVTAVGRKKGYP